MRSIRGYLLSRLLTGTALVLVLATASVYVLVVRSLESQFDRNLADRVEGFASLLFQTAEEVSFEFSDELMPEYEREWKPAYFQIWYGDGRLLERSNSLDGRDLEFQSEPRAQPSYWEARLPDGRAGRFICRRLVIHHVYPEIGPERPDAWDVDVVVARGREDLLAAERLVLFGCLGAFAVLTALVALVTWSSVRRALAPARALAATLDEIQVDRPPKQLEVGRLPDELVPMAEKTDALLGRVDRALERERRTTADISHELRTPLSELLTVAEVALRDTEPAAHTEALRVVRDVAQRMGRSVSTLLKLARIETGTECGGLGHAPLGEIVRELLRSLSAIERERRLHVHNRVGVEEVVDADEDVLRIVASNLISNALYYSPHAGEVVCRLEREGAAWSLVVENEALDLQPADLTSLSEPFWQKDGARSDRHRFGLGLALSHSLAAKTGMELGFELSGRTFRALLQGREKALATSFDPPSGNGSSRN